MRILMVTSEFPPSCGGIGWYVYYLSRELLSKGHEITILQRASGPLDAFDSFQRIPVHTGSIPLLNASRMVRNIRAFLKSAPHDIAIVHATPTGAWIGVVPTVLVSHWCIAEGEKKFYKGAYDFKSVLHIIFGAFYREVERRSVQGVDKVAVVSKAMQQEFAKHYSIDAHYVGNGVDTTVFSPSMVDGNRAVLLPSMLRSGKGVREAVQTLQIVRNKGCDIPFRFIGAGPMKPWLQKKIVENELSGVELLPPVEHARLKMLYQQSSIVFLPSYYEGLPTIALEAMASGLPVVATDAGGTAEAVLNGKTGFIHPVRDVDGMAASILALDRDKDIAGSMGQAGLQRVCGAYTWKTIGNHFDELIGSII
jgi:glycosyltransferase involved in cell wall biosynthesis